jgi:hypothetical protein
VVGLAFVQLHQLLLSEVQPQLLQVMLYLLLHLLVMLQQVLQVMIYLLLHLLVMLQQVLVEMLYLLLH